MELLPVQAHLCGRKNSVIYMAQRSSTLKDIERLIDLNHLFTDLHIRHTN